MNVYRMVILLLVLALFLGCAPSPVVKVWTIAQFPVSASAAPVAPTIPLTYSNGKYTGIVTILDFDRLPVAPQPGWIGIEVTNPQTSGAALSNWSYEAAVIAPTPTPTNTPLPSPTNTPMPTPTATPTPLPTLPI